MKRQIEKVVNHVKMEDEDYLDVVFWRSKSTVERLSEVTRLRKNYYTWLNGSFPERMVRSINFRLFISDCDENDRSIDLLFQT